jgi:hypothetical protein
MSSLRNLSVDLARNKNAAQSGPVLLIRFVNYFLRIFGKCSANTLGLWLRDRNSVLFGNEVGI